MSKFATVLVAGGDDGALQPRKAALESAGFVVETAATGFDFVAKAKSLLPSVALLEDTLPDMPAEQLARAELADPLTDLPAMMLLENSNGAVGTGFDDVLEPGVDHAVLVARIQPLLRLATMRAELGRRRATAARVSGSPDSADSAVENREQNVLLVATDAVIHAELSAAIDRRIAVVREPDPFRAGQRLETEQFDAVVVILGSDEFRERQLHLCYQIRSNPRIFDLPVLMITAPDSFATASEPYRAGATVAICASFKAVSAAVVIERLIRRQRQRWELRSGLMATLAKDTADSIGCIYSAEFARAHVEGSIGAGEPTTRQRAIAVFNVTNLPLIRQQFGDEAAVQLLQQIAGFVVGLVRAEDVCARLGDHRLCVVMPETNAREAEIVVERVTAVLTHAEFHLTKEICAPIGVWIQGGHASLKPGDTVDGFIGRAIADTL